jgi:hypothetical protein
VWMQLVENKYRIMKNIGLIHIVFVYYKFSLNILFN